MKKSESGRLTLVFCGVGLFLVGGLFGQAKQAGAWGDLDKTRQADLNRQKLTRGSIWSSDGAILAREDGAYGVALNSKNSPSSQAFLLELSEISGIAVPELQELVNTPEWSRAVWDLRLDKNEADLVRASAVRWDAGGLERIGSPYRSFPLRETTALLLGSCTESNQRLRGQGGIEEGLDSYLLDGELPDSLNGLTPGVREQISESDSRSVQLTIHADLQRRVQAAVKNAVEYNLAEHGAGVVLNPKTGEVLAMANWPTFDPSAPADEANYFNLAHQGRLEPGSMVKLLTLGLGLDEGVVTLDEQLEEASGPLKREGRFGPHIKNHKGKYFPGADARLAIAESCNVSASVWAERIGAKKLRGLYEKAGVFEAQATGLPHSSTGIIASTIENRLRDLMVVGWGQSMSMSPLQAASMFGAVANQGVMMKPRLVKSMGGVELLPEEQARLFTPETSAAVLDLSGAVMTEGTGKTLNVPGIKLGGKTGSVEKPVTGLAIGNFVGFAPLDDPEYVVLVMIKHPQGPRKYGAETAGPAFVEIIRGMAALDLLELSPDSSEEEDTDEPALLETSA